VSGKFLCDKETFSEIRKLFAEFRGLSSKLGKVEYDLRCFDDPEWIASFEKQCQRLKRDPKRQLIARADSLETQKAALASQIDEVRHKLLLLEPTALDIRHSLVGAPAQYWHPLPSPKRRKEKNAAVEARNAAIDCLLHLPNDLAICKALDDEFPPTQDRPAPQLPNSWFERFGVKSFVEAYRKCPHCVHTMIGKRRGLQSPHITSVPHFTAPTS
jgi:hypothetical protein